MVVTNLIYLMTFGKVMIPYDVINVEGKIYASDLGQLFFIKYRGRKKYSHNKHATE